MVRDTAKPGRPWRPARSDSNQTIRRDHTRHLVTRFVWYRTLEAKGDPTTEGLSYSVDISRGGMGMVTTSRIPLGTLVFVQASFDKYEGVLSAAGRVVFCREADTPGQHRIGLEFIALPPDGADLVSKHFR